MWKALINLQKLPELGNEFGGTVIESMATLLLDGCGEQ